MKTAKYWIAIGVVIALFWVGFFIGRSSVEVKTVTMQVHAKPIHAIAQVSDSDNTESTEVPADPILPLKPDTIKIPGKPEYHTLVVDTAAIIKEYIEKHKYNITLFNNEHGKVIIYPSVQYNKISEVISYDFTPIETITTKTIIPVITPYIQASYNSFGYYGAGGGVFYHNIGIGAKYITNFKEKGFEISTSLKL